MANINDLEYNKFERNTVGDVVVKTQIETEDPLAEITKSIEDLESAKFTNDGKVRIIITN